MSRWPDAANFPRFLRGREAPAERRAAEGLPRRQAEGNPGRQAGGAAPWRPGSAGGSWSQAGLLGVGLGVSGQPVPCPAALGCRAFRFVSPALSRTAARKNFSLNCGRSSAFLDFSAAGATACSWPFGQGRAGQPLTAFCGRSARCNLVLGGLTDLQKLPRARCERDFLPAHSKGQPSSGDRAGGGFLSLLSLPCARLLGMSRDGPSDCS